MAQTPTISAFNKWSTDHIRVQDPGLVRYICLDARLAPKTGARYAQNRFHKSKTFIVERLMNKVTIAGHKGKKHLKSSGHNTGKKEHAYNIVFDCFLRIEKQLKKNPVEVFVKALENAAPREEIITIEYGGARYPKAVECSSQRRVDFALRQFTQGAYTGSFNKKKSIVTALTEELIAAYECSQKSQAIAKKQEIERQADSSR